MQITLEYEFTNANSHLELSSIAYAKSTVPNHCQSNQTLEWLHHAMFSFILSEGIPYSIHEI